MKQSILFRRDILKDNAKNALEGYWGTFILALFFMVLLLFGFILMMIFPEAVALYAIDHMPSAIGRVLTTILSYVVNLVMQAGVGLLEFGICYMCLKVYCRSYTVSKDLFYGFGPQTFKTICILSVLNTVVNFICMAPFDYLRNGFKFSFTGDMDLVRLLFILIAALIGYLIYVPFGLIFDLAFFVKLDFPDKEYKEVLRDSCNLLRNNMKAFFYLQCSFIPLVILAYLSFGIGMLWLIPYMKMTYAMFYIELMKLQSQDTVSANTNL